MRENGRAVEAQPDRFAAIDSIVARGASPQEALDERVAKDPLAALRQVGLLES